MMIRARNSLIILFAAVSWLQASSTIYANGQLQLMNGAQVEVNGSWLNNGSFDPGNSTVVFTGSSLALVGSSSGESFFNLTIDKPSAKGSLVLSSNVSLDGTLAILNGSLATGVFQLQMSSNAVIDASPADIIGTILPYTQFVGTSAYVNSALGVALTGNFLNNIGTLSVLAYQSAIAVGGNEGISRHWIISSLNAPSGRDLSLSWDASLDNGIHTSAQVYRSEDGGATWQPVGEPVLLEALGSPTRTITVTNIDGFSSWTVGDGTEDQSLPAHISDFTANVAENSVHLSWIVESEKENRGFIISRSRLNDADSADATIAHYSVNPELAGLGSSTASRGMEWTDRYIIPGTTYRYILKSEDYSGLIEPIAETEITVPLAETPERIPETFVIRPLYPNPFNAGTILHYELPTPENVLITLYTVTGKQAGIIFNAVQPEGYYDYHWIPENSLSSGVYILSFRAGSNQYSQKFTYLK